jgi:hypothetical protein
LQDVIKSVMEQLKSKMMGTGLECPNPKLPTVEEELTDAGGSSHGDNNNKQQQQQQSQLTQQQYRMRDDSGEGLDKLEEIGQAETPTDVGDIHF